jgi:hypothetical protein
MREHYNSAYWIIFETIILIIMWTYLSTLSFAEETKHIYINMDKTYEQCENEAFKNIYQIINSIGENKNNTMPEQLCDDIESHIQYKDNIDVYGSDRYASVDEIINKRAGDCKVFGVLTYDSLKKAGYETHLVALYNRHSGHIIVIFKEKDYWKAISNGNLLDYKCKNYRDLFKIFIGYSDYKFINEKGYGE